MKKLLVLLLVVLSACTQSINYDLEEEYFEERKGIWYYKGTVFNGEIFTLYSDKTLKKKATYKDGKKEGVWEFYFENSLIQTTSTKKVNGHLAQKGSYKADKKDGVWVYYSSGGELAFKRSYKDGKLDGAQKSYKNGKLDRIESYKAGKRIEGKE